MKKQNITFSEFKKELETNDELQRQFQANPLEAIKQFDGQPIYLNDKLIYRIVVWVLAILILSIVASIILLMFKSEGTEIDKLVPTILTAIASAALGGLTGLLAPSPRSNPT